MYIEGFRDREDILTQFEASADALNDAVIYYAKYRTGSYEGDAFVLFEKDGVLYEVHGSHCSCHGLEGQWSPEETSMKALEFRWFQEGQTPSVCENDEEVLELKRIVLGEMFEQNVLLN